MAGKTGFLDSTSDIEINAADSQINSNLRICGSINKKGLSLILRQPYIINT